MRVRSLMAAAALAGMWSLGSAMAQTPPPILIGVSTPATGVAAMASE